jgi:hypothetical protein
MQDSNIANKERGNLVCVFMVLVTAILEMLFILRYKSICCKLWACVYGTARFGATFLTEDPAGESAAPVPPLPGRTSIMGFLLRENIQSHFIKPATS